MMATVSLVNVHHLIWIKKTKRKKFFFPVMRTLRIYLLNNFQICHTVVLTIVIMLYITSLVLFNLIASYLITSTYLS